MPLETPIDDTPLVRYRYTFGASSDHMLLTPSGRPANRAVVAYVGPTGSTRHTDLQTLTGQPLDYLRSVNGRYPFRGPDGVRRLWVSTGTTERQMLIGDEVYDELSDLIDNPPTGGGGGGTPTPDATTLVKGKAALATPESTLAGTDETSIVTPATLKAVLDAIPTTGTVLKRRYADGAYAALPTTKPAGVTVVEYLGPRQPTDTELGGPRAWIGYSSSQVPATYEYAPLT